MAKSIKKNASNVVELNSVALKMAIARHQKEEVLRWLERMPTLKKVSAEDQSLLKFAIKHHQYYVLKVFWEKFGSTKAWVKKLITEQTDVYYIEAAIHLGEIDILKKLFTHFPNVELLHANGKSMLLWAAKSYQWEVLRYILEMNYEPHYVMVLLHALIQSGDDKTLAFLLNWKISLEGLHERGESLVQWAISNKQWKIIHLLVSKKIEIKQAENALVSFTTQGKLMEVAKLVDAGLNPNIKNEQKESLLLIAAKNQYWDLVSFFIESQVSLNVKDQQNHTLLHFLCSQNKKHILELLLGYNLHLNVKNDQDKTPMMIAIEKGHLDIVKLLLLKRSNLYAQQNLKWRNEIENTLAKRAITDEQSQEMLSLITDGEK